MSATEPATQTQSLAAFLLARLDEDEAAARAEFDLASAYPPPDGMTEEYGWHRIIRSRSGVVMSSTFAPGALSPARVLADVAARRAIVAEVERTMRLGTNGLGPGVLRHLASVYSDHPEFREEWRA